MKKILALIALASFGVVLAGCPDDKKAGPDTAGSGSAAVKGSAAASGSGSGKGW